MKTKRYGPYMAEVLRVIDGDSIKVAVHLWPGMVVKANLRLSGINTPEKRGRINGVPVSEREKLAAQAATAFPRAWLADTPMVTVYDLRLGKYAGRVLGKLKKGRLTLHRALLKASHARLYRGGKRRPWYR